MARRAASFTEADVARICGPAQGAHSIEVIVRSSSNESGQRSAFSPLQNHQINKNKDFILRIDVIELALIN